jgi:hypothetical protein
MVCKTLVRMETIGHILLAGTAVLVGMTGYVIVESVKNPQLTPPGVLESAIAIEICQVVFVILSAIIIFAKR